MLKSTTRLFVAVVGIALTANIANACGHAKAYRTTYRTYRVARPVHYVSQPMVRQHTKTVYKPAVVHHETEVRPPISEVKVVVPVKTKTSIRSGATININGDFFGREQGRVFVKLKSVRMDADIIAWTPRTVTVRLPIVTTRGGAPADLEVYTSTGKLVKDLDILLKSVVDDIEQIEAITVATAP